ncbi:MAG: T9SS C-terminal target domain-containing protein [Chlorobi bacterium CHB2]|nr:T9SS C-terminal target domain-containing protein [Chlorobi bacterium CHB2]
MNSTYQNSQFAPAFFIKKAGYIYLLLAVLSPITLNAQWEQVGESLHGVDYLPNGTIISVGEFGRIFCSFDDGSTWIRNVIPTKKSLHSVDFATPQIGVAVGDSGTIARTTDGGYSWKIIPSPTSVLLRRISFLKESLVGLAIGDQKTILLTTDGGLTWNSSHPNISDSFAISFTDVAFASPNRWFVVGNKGTALLSENNGTSWKPLPFSELEAFAGISFLDSLHGLLITSKAQAFYTMDGGKTWVRKNSVPKYIDFVEKVQLITQNKAWFGGLYFNGKKLAVTNDTASSWSRDGYYGMPITQFCAIYDLDFYDSAHGVIVGDNSMIMKTRDGGMVWDTLSYLNVRIHPKYGRTIREIVGIYDCTTIGISSANNETIIGTSSISGVAAYTTDNTMWRMKYSADNTHSINEIEFVTPQHGFMATGEGLFKSTNNGISWSLVKNIPIKTDRSISAVSFINPDTGLIINYNTTWRTTDGGGTWQSSVLPDVQYAADIVLTTPLIAYASTKERVFKSTDGGNSWVTLLEYKKQGFGSFQKMYFQDSARGFIASTFGSIYKTTDGGITWDSNSVSQGGFMGVRFFSDSLGFAYGLPALLMVTNDGGKSWVREYPYPPRTEDSNIVFYDLKLLPGDTTLLLVGSNTCLQRSFHPKQYTRGSNENPYLFINIIPNPLRLGAATITIYGLYSVPTDNLSLRVFDLYGRQVADLSTMLELTGSRTIAEATIDASKFASGVYLVQFQAGGDSRTERIVITR